MYNYIIVSLFFSAASPSVFNGYLTELHPLLIFIIGMILGFLLLLILLSSYYSRHNAEQNAQLEKMTADFLTERLQSEAVLEKLDIGVMAFSPDGQMRVANQKMKQLLALDEFPRTLDDFLSNYGETNGLKAQAVLGNALSTAEFEQGKRIILLQLQNTLASDKGKVATLITARDITAVRNEERQRKEFVANVSHELKTPLTIIKTYSESLLDWGLEEKNKASVRLDLERILQDVNRMEALIKDLLLLSSIDSRGRNLHMDEIDLQVLLRQIVERCQLQAREKQITLNINTLSVLPKVFVDLPSMDRVFMNLLQNAIKYTEEGGKVDVFISRIWDDIVIKVKDNGPGIDQKHLKAIFERFYRVDNTGARKYGGTGLGLSIAKELTELHHGKITVSSILTQGTEFLVTLPVAAKVFRQTMLALTQRGAKADEDELSLAVEAFLLTKAFEKGTKAQSLHDLTKAERDAIMQPYRETDGDTEEENSEDFAGILSGSGNTRTTERGQFDQTVPLPLRAMETQQAHVILLPTDSERADSNALKSDTNEEDSAEADALTLLPIDETLTALSGSKTGGGRISFESIKKKDLAETERAEGEASPARPDSAELPETAQRPIPNGDSEK